MSVSEYVALADASYTRGDEVEALDRLGGGYTILERDKDYMVFSRETDGHIIVSCRGTSGKDDLIPDAFIALGLLRLHPRAKKVIDAVRRWKVADPGLSVTGHSLGGKLAALAGASEGVLAVTFNQGSSPLDSNIAAVKVGEIFGGLDFSNVIHFTTVTDIVSTSAAISQNSHTIVIKAPSMINPLTNHYLDAFRGLDDTKYRDFIDKEHTRITTTSKKQSFTGYVEREYYDTRNMLIAYGMFRKKLAATGVDSVKLESIEQEAMPTMKTYETLYDRYQDLIKGDAQAVEDFRIEQRVKNLGDVEEGWNDLAARERSYQNKQIIKNESLEDILNIENRLAGRPDVHIVDESGGLPVDAHGLPEIPKGPIGGGGDVKVPDEPKPVERPPWEEEGGGKEVMGENTKQDWRDPEWIESEFEGIGKNMTPEELVAKLKSNLDTMYRDGDMTLADAEKIREKIRDLTFVIDIDKTMTNLGLSRVGNAIKAGFRKSIETWSSTMKTFAKNNPNAVKALKAFGSMLEALVWVAQVYFVYTDWKSVELDEHTLTELEIKLNDPSLRKYKFVMDNIMKMIQDKHLEDQIKLGLHVGEVFVGALLTIFAPYAAVPYWLAVGAEQLAEIPIDDYKNEWTTNEFVMKWYGSPPSVWTYLKNRDVYEMDESARESARDERGYETAKGQQTFDKFMNNWSNTHTTRKSFVGSTPVVRPAGIAGGVYDYAFWVYSTGDLTGSVRYGNQLSYSVKEKLYQAAGGLKAEVMNILNDNSIVGLGDTRYERLNTLKTTVSKTAWERGMSGIMSSSLELNEEYKDFDISSFEGIGRLGMTTFDRPATTIQEYRDLENVLYHIRMGASAWQSEKSRYFIAVGDRALQGDNETEGEYASRVENWARYDAQTQLVGVGFTGAEVGTFDDIMRRRYGGNGTPGGGVSTPSAQTPSQVVQYFGDDGTTVCQLNPSKKRKVVRTGFDWRHTPHLSVGGGSSSLAVSSVM